uniref:Fibulin 7 n=1 Tax=Zosterops lateralis melanops TaxID=1220523 RepID=A0A8D2NJJ9_ZOSLA
MPPSTPRAKNPRLGLLGEFSSFSCLSRPQLLAAIQQMQQLLKGQETRFSEGLHAVRSRLSPPPNSSPFHHLTGSCPALQAPAYGRKFGTKYLVDRKVHFACDPGFQLLGSSTRMCQANGSWTGEEPRCAGTISECSSSPCQNGGTCLEGLNNFKCLCPPQWTGTTCQYQAQTDLNECKVYHQEGGPRLCAHVCVNIPGSFCCSCPAGYVLLGDGKSCEGECPTGHLHQHWGEGFQCVTPQCPPATGNVSYVKTSPFQWERNLCPMESRSCHQAPKTISFHYLSLPSKLQTPAPLFRMATAAAPGRPGPDSLRFGMAGSNSRGHFMVQRLDRHTGELLLVQSLQGPRTIHVDVDMAEYLDRVFQTKHLSKITLFVSAYEF